VYADKALYVPALNVGEPIPLDDLLKDGPIVDTAGREVSFKGSRTLLILGLAECPACKQQLPLLYKWSTDLDNLQIVYSVRGADISAFTKLLERAGNLRIVHDKMNRLASALQARGAPTVFLIDEEAVIRWRMTGFSLWYAQELDKVVRQFDSGGSITTDYWERNYNDRTELPPLPLLDRLGHSVDLSDVIDGSPTIIVYLRDKCPQCREIAPKVVKLINQYADTGIHLVFVLDYLSENERHRALEYIQDYSPDVPDKLVSLLEHPGDISDDLSYFSQLTEDGDGRMYLLLDPESRLSASFAIPAAPFALFINARGEVEDFLPFFWFSASESDVPTVLPTLDVMTDLINKLLLEPNR